MEEIKHLQKKYCSQAMIMSILVAVAFIFLGYKAVGKGFLLASIFSIINFSLMARFSPLTLGKSQTRARSIALFSIILRYAVLSIPLIVSIKTNSLNFAAVVVGLFSVQLVMIFDQVIVNRLALTRKA